MTNPVIVLCDVCRKEMGLTQSWLLDSPHVPGIEQKWLMCSIECCLAQVQLMASEPSTIVDVDAAPKNQP